MNSPAPDSWHCQPDFTSPQLRENERRIFAVAVLTAAMMVVEIIGGWWFNSMAVLADGWHMGTHALALGVSLFAYRFARLHAADPRYTFGTGKIHALGSFASAMLLGFVAAMVLAESLWMLLSPESIAYNEALLVAVVGLIVNLLSAWWLKHDHHHEHDNAHAHDHGFRAAYAHVITDALTSVLAIAALLIGKYARWDYADPLVGIVGALIIGKWAWNLLKDTVPLLLDRLHELQRVEAVRETLEGSGDSTVTDLHLWQIAPGKFAAMITIATTSAHGANYFRARLEEADLAHVTIEVVRQ